MYNEFKKVFPCCFFFSYSLYFAVRVLTVAFALISSDRYARLSGKE